MSLEVRIDGAAELKRLAAHIRAEGNKSLASEMSTALSQATQPVQREIRSEAERVMPTRGGYRALLSKSLRFRTSKRTAGQEASLRLITYADGTRERRDVKALERGTLRHPVYGRSRKIKRGPRAGTSQANPWRVTSIRAGFHERGTAVAADEAVARLAEVLEDFAARLIDK